MNRGKRFVDGDGVVHVVEYALHEVVLLLCCPSIDSADWRKTSEFRDCDEQATCLLCVAQEGQLWTGPKQ